MTPSQEHLTGYDAVVIGGGIMGSFTAIRLAEAGLRVALVERNTLGTAASGVNAGTHSMQNKPISLLKHALLGQSLWREMSSWLGVETGHRQMHGFILAHTETEAATLEANVARQREAGIAVEMLSGAEARAIEPEFSNNIVAASHLPVDGFSDSLRSGRIFRAGLRRFGVTVLENTMVRRIERNGGRYRLIADEVTVEAKRLVLAAGVWLGDTLEMLGVTLPVDYTVKQVLVLERMAAQIRSFVGHVSGLLTLKQNNDGRVVIGGGWLGTGDRERGAFMHRPNSLISSLRLAQHGLPCLAETSLLRSWLGLEANMPDGLPLLGAVPGQEDAFVIGCVGGGYTMGPAMALLLSKLMLGRNPELPLFDPARFTQNCAATA